MRSPRTTPTTRACLERIDTLSVSAAKRDMARVEFERAEALVDTVTDVIAAVKASLRKVPDALPAHRQRLEEQ